VDTVFLKKTRFCSVVKRELSSAEQEVSFQVGFKHAPLANALTHCLAVSKSVNVYLFPFLTFKRFLWSSDGCTSLNNRELCLRSVRLPLLNIYQERKALHRRFLGPHINLPAM
jgi:hypothetical protein